MSSHGTTTGVSYGNPSGIGLLGLAIVTLVASSQKLGLTNGVAFILPWSIFLGAIAQLYAGAIDMKVNNTFGGTAFIAYGVFWLGVSMSWLIQNGVLGEALQNSYDAEQLGFAYIGYLIFTIFMTIGAMETNKLLFAIFFLIDLLFIGLALSSFHIMYEFSHNLAGYSELLISLLSFYGCGANVLNTHFGREFLPIGKPFGIFK